MLCFNAAIAQTTSFIYYGVEQGLSQSQVQCITQDDDGNCNHDVHGFPSVP